MSDPASAIKKAIEVFEITDLSHLFQVPLPVHNTGLRAKMRMEPAILRLWATLLASIFLDALAERPFLKLKQCARSSKPVALASNCDLERVGDRHRTNAYFGV